MEEVEEITEVEPVNTPLQEFMDIIDNAEHSLRGVETSMATYLSTHLSAEVKQVANNIVCTSYAISDPVKMTEYIEGRLGVLVVDTLATADLVFGLGSAAGVGEHRRSIIIHKSIHLIHDLISN